MSDRIHHVTRRTALKTAALTSGAMFLSPAKLSAAAKLDGTVKLGLIADLHQDVMHDGPKRLDAFLAAVKEEDVDGILQLGDFAYPNEKNQFLADRFNSAHEMTLHVIGNHEMDDNCTKQDCIDRWEMPGRYYTTSVGGLQLIVLDGNDKGSPDHGGGYPCFIGNEQVDWLKDQLANAAGPVMVFCHQPLAGNSAVDNAEQIQAILSAASDKILLAVNGHTHVDDVLKVGDVTYMHINSASYKWMGGNYQHNSYEESVHTEYPWISYTCPYRDSLFAFMTIDPNRGVIDVRGRQSEWVGASPGELGAKGGGSLTNGEEIAPRIRDRRLEIVLN